ncbi:hypothetical protein F4Z98_05445 [Candidatus Poribacteria bacterium]|nr:hypothetical protein [Candidatus Poribacteria bacterium]
MQLYAEIGIPEYFIYDVDRRYLPSPLLGFRLIGDAYVEIASLARGGLPSVRLGLEFHLLDESLGIYDPEAEAWLKTSAERAEDAEERANQEADARQKAEAEVVRLQEALARLSNIRK